MTKKQRKTRLLPVIVMIMTLVLVLLTVQAAPVFGAESKNEGDLPETGCTAALLMDARTGTVLYEKNAELQLQPASMTKMMTALLVVENLDLDKKVTVPREAANLLGSSMDLKEGEVLTVRQLLNALLVHSANDAAVALAIEVSGSVDAFLELMNKRAQELGMDNTNYISTNGFVNDARHHTTAIDSTIIARKILEDKTLAPIVKKASYTIPATNKSPERKLKTTNKLLKKTKKKIKVNGVERFPKYEGAMGVKTGFMAGSGYCITASAERDGMTLIAVVMQANTDLNRYVDAITMFDYGFDNYYSYELKKPHEKTGRIKVKYGHNCFVQTETEEGVYATLPKQAEGKDMARCEIVLKDHVAAPIKKGKKVGEAKVYENGKVTGTSDIVITKSVKKGGPWTAFYISDLLFTIICAVIALIVVLCIVRKINIDRRRRIEEMKRRRAMSERARRRAAANEYKRRRDWPF